MSLIKSATGDLRKMSTGLLLLSLLQALLLRGEGLHQDDPCPWSWLMCMIWENFVAQCERSGNWRLLRGYIVVIAIFATLDAIDMG
jgi:hypothetical protein